MSQEFITIKIWSKTRDRIRDLSKEKDRSLSLLIDNSIQVFSLFDNDLATAVKAKHALEFVDSAGGYKAITESMKDKV